MRELRKAVLNWYSFDHGNNALVMGPDADIFVELLESRSLETDTAPRINRKYDYIVAVDLLEHAKQDPEQLLKELYKLLSDEGTLLLCCRNRFGIKYFCGAVDDIVKSPMQGIRGEIPGLMTRAQLIDILQKTGFKSNYTYYLMPDITFTQAVFTDALLPKDSIRDRVLPSDTYDSPLLAAEFDLYDDIVREGMLPHTANAFMIECRKVSADSVFKRVIYAALSTDRGQNHGFATILYSDGTACKKSLWPEGRNALRVLYDNLEVLKSRGIPVIEQKITREGIVMPLVTDMQLMEYIRKQVMMGDKDAFLGVFRQIEQDALASSDKCSISLEDAETRWGVKPAQLGTILETGYIDMIPYNGFYTDGRIMYYDQEYTLHKCPVGYILFRAIMYTWLHIPEAENLISKEEIADVFKLTSLWKCFSEYENKFIYDNRNWKKYNKIYKGAIVDREVIKKRASELAGDTVLHYVQKVQLELLKKVDDLCRKNGIRYMAIHGTLLGAVRHKGFIPWDDDVDIAMLREDYERFIQACEEQLNDDYFLQTPENDQSCFYGGYCKLRDNRTSALEYKNTGKDCNQGIWIDILPLDHCPRDEQRRRKLQKKITFWQRIRLAYLYKHWTNVLCDVRGGEVSLYYILRKVISQEITMRRLRTLYQSCAPEGYRSILANYYGDRDNKNVFLEQECSDLKEMPFEDIQIMVPAAYDKWLRQRYGECYMEMPDAKQRYSHSSITFDPDTPFAVKVKENL